MRTYTLDAPIEGKAIYPYTERAQDSKKRSSIGISSYDNIKSFDELTAVFYSMQNLNEEFNRIYNENHKIVSPCIIVDPKGVAGLDSSFITDIVYNDDYKEINKKDNIKLWAIDYLTRNPSDIEYFNGIRTIYTSKHKGEILDSSLIYLIVNTYLSSGDYKRYRDTYFTLKKIDINYRKNNEIHR